MSKDGNDVAVRVVTLIQTVDIEVSQANRFEFVEFRIGETMFLFGEFADAVRRVRLARVVLTDRQVFQLTKDRRGRRADDFAHTVTTSSFQDAECAEDVYV